MPKAKAGSLAGQAVLVTGSGRRIGAAVARRLAGSACDVVLHYHKSGAEAGRVAASLRKLGVKAVTVEADLADAADRKHLVGAAADALGTPLTLLVNNASSFPPRELSDLTLEHLHEALAVNAWAPFELTRALAAQLPRGKRGSVVNFLDARIVDDDRRHVGYFLAKRMLADFTRLGALELAPRIAVNGVAPGPTLPPPGMAEKRGDALMARLRLTLPLKLNPAPQDLAEAVHYLVSSRVVTGQVLFVDGGRHLGRQP